MRYATPTRSAHRAVSAGGGALILRPFPGTAGQHRTSVRSRRSRTRGQRHLRRDPHQAATLLTHGLAALIVLGIVVMLGVLILADDGPPSGADSRTSRAAFAAPLTAAEVFPDQGSLFRVGEVRAEADCPVAVTGGLRPVLQGYACSQAIRAVLAVPYADYQVTAGVLTLPDAQSATSVGERVREEVETGDGGFAGLSGAETPVGTPVAWRTHDRFLLYCVIVNPAGALVANDDPAVAQITADILDTHLAGTVLAR
jgi:hypothetical protein